MNKIILILLTLLLLMLILNHAEDKRMENLFGTYGDGKYVDPSTSIPLPPSSPRGHIRYLPTTAPPPGTPIWCPPPQKIGSPPLDTEADECVY